MYITDLTHFLDEKGAIGPPSGPARRLADFMAAVVVAASAQEPGVTSDLVRCWKSECKGPITATVAADDVVEWACGKCREQGRISNWRGSFWDLSERH